MNTPIYDFVKKYNEAHISRLHMPGHKGQAFLGCEDIDITEINGADVISVAEGIIKESQNNAASLFDVGKTFYSTEGSSQCIKAMLEAVRSYYVKNASDKKQRPLILAARNVHRAMIDACAIIDIDIDFIMPDNSKSICSVMVTPDIVRKKLSSCKELPMGVYITSPDYLGNIADIEGIAAVCDEYKIPLIVDNAHGAYLAFMKENQHPVKLGAAICCDSAHKTLPVLTGGAYIHVSQRYKDKLAGYISRSLTLFGSTSPSYLIMQSLDLCNKYLADNYRKKLADTIENIDAVKQALTAIGIDVMNSEKLKIVIDAASSGYMGEEIADELRRFNIECEYADRQYVVLMFSTENRDIDYKRVINWSENTVLVKNKKEAIVYNDIYSEKIKRAMTIREAVFSLSEMRDIEKAEGSICASEIISCPPAIPIAVSGEIIDRQMIELFRSYNIHKVCVVC